MTFPQSSWKTCFATKLIRPCQCRQLCVAEMPWVCRAIASCRSCEACEHEDTTNARLLLPKERPACTIVEATTIASGKGIETIRLSYKWGSINMNKVMLTWSNESLPSPPSCMWWSMCGYAVVKTLSWGAWGGMWWGTSVRRSGYVR